MHITSSCSDLLTPRTIFMFAVPLSCRWHSDIHMRIEWEGSAAITLDSVVGVLGKVKTMSGFSDLSQPSSLTLSAPFERPKPVVVITAPGLLSSCDGLTVSGHLSKGAAGTAFTVAWGLERPAGMPEGTFLKLLANVQSVKDLTLVFAPSWLPPANAYVITLTLTNWLLESTEASVTIKKAAFPVPSVGFEGDSTLFATRDALVSSSVIAASSACSEQQGEPMVSWTEIRFVLEMFWGFFRFLFLFLGLFCLQSPRMHKQARAYTPHFP